VREYVVDLSAVTSWEGFVAAFDGGFVRPVGGDGWGGNLDALNDYLWWPEEHPYRLVLRGWVECAPVVTRRRTRDGRPVLEVIAEIFRENPQAEVVFEPGRPPR
jgi:Barstar (barnase inhibitor)